MGTIVDGLLKGMGAAGWIIGFIALLGAFLIIVGIIGLALSYVAQGFKDKEDTENGNDTDD